MMSFKMSNTEISMGPALAGVAQWTEGWTEKQTVAGSTQMPGLQARSPVGGD